MVCPTICGKITLARLHVRNTFFSPFWFIASIRFKSLGSMNGPFFNDRDIAYLYRLTIRFTATTHNILVGFLVFAGLVAQRWFAPRALWTRQTNRLTSFTTAMWMIAWTHGGATYTWADALMALA